MQTGNRVRLEIPSGSLFTAALSQNAGLNGRVALPSAIGGNANARSIIQTLQITSAEQLDWEVWFWGTSTFQNSGHPDLEANFGFWSFSVSAGDGKRIGGAGLYYYYIDGLGIQYQDYDAQNWRRAHASMDDFPGCYLNMTLVNRSAAAKTANLWFQMSLGIEPTQGW